jgi:autotransporter-associated beta strand protein
MKPKIHRFAALALASFTVALTHSHAASYYWDTDGLTPGAGGATPNGAWTTDGTTWSASPNGSLATSAFTTTADDDLVFSAGTDATGSYTVTLDNAQLAKSLTFRSGSATISGAGGGVINLGGTGAIRVNSDLTATPLSAIIGNNTDTLISGSAGLTKTGVGTLTLDGSGLHTFTGGLNLNGGTLALNFSNLTTPTDFIASGNALSFGGGALTITGKSTGDTAQTLGNVTVNSGGGDFRVNPNNGTSTTVTLGSLATSASGGSLIIGQALGSGTGTLAITSTTDKDATGIYGGRVVFANGIVNTGYDWATTETEAPGPFALSAYTGYTALDLTAGTDTANSLVTATAAMTGSRTTHSLKFAPTATGQTLALGAGNTLSLTSGGLLMTSGQTNMNITEGNITAGDGTAPADLVVHQFNPSQPLGIGVTGGNLNNTPEIFSIITDNGAQPVTLVKNGPGSIRFLGANTFTGGIIVNQGSVDFGNLSLNNNPITFNANAFFYTGGTHLTSGGITLNNGSQVTVCNNNASFTVNANVTGTGGLSAANGGQGAITLNLNGTGNTFTGPLRFTANNGTQAAAINVASLVDTDTFGTGNITFGAGTASSISHNFGLAAGATEPVTLNNRRFEMGGLQVNQQINNNSAQPLTITGDLLVTGTRAKNLQFGGNGSGLSTFAGVISNHPTPTEPGTVPNAERKTANGNTLTLASIEGIEVGATITGTFIPAGTTITAINPSTRVVTLNQNYTAANNSNFNVGVIYTIPGVINSNSVTKAGTSHWVLSGNNTYTGPTNNIGGGTLTLSGDNIAATGGVTTTNSRLNIGHANALGTGTLSIGGTAPSIDNTSGAPLTIATNNAQVWNGDFTFHGSDDLNLGTGAVALGGTRLVTVTANTLTIGGVISGVSPRGLQKLGAGTMVLNGANTYEGNTAVNNGTLTLGVDDCLADVSNVVIGNGILDLAADVNDTAGTLDVNAAATINLGSGTTLAFADSSGVDWTGGTLNITGSFVSGSSVRFGTTNAGLTPEQLGLITVNGSGPVAINSSGFLTTGTPTGFAAWQAANSTAGGLGEDHDNDGVDNGTEFFLGGTTNTTGFTALPGVTNTGGTLSITWTKAGSYGGNYGTDFVVETSATLDNPWVTETLGVNVTITGDIVTYTFPAGTRNFARLKVTGP